MITIRLPQALFGLLFIALLAACQSPAEIPAAATRTPNAPVAPGATAALATPGPINTVEGSVALPPTADTRLAEVTEREQLVDWRMQDSSDWLLADIGQSLNPGNQVRTGTNSRATVIFIAGAVVRLSENSLFTVTTTETGPLLQVWLGQIFVTLTETFNPGATFEVETPNGLAGVRGSYLSVRITPSGRVITACLEGNCFLRNALGETPLVQGQQSEITASDRPPIAPVPMDGYQFNEWFDIDPATVQLALNTGVLTGDRLPTGCNPATGENCRIRELCDQRTGQGCRLRPECDRTTGAGCELPSGCNPVTGQGCTSPRTCDPTTGAGCELPNGCNRVTGVGCLIDSRPEGENPPTSNRPTPEPGVIRTAIAATRTANPNPVQTSIATQTPRPAIQTAIATRTLAANLPSGTPTLANLLTATPDFVATRNALATALVLTGTPNPSNLRTPLPTPTSGSNIIILPPTPTGDGNLIINPPILPTLTLP